MASSARHRADTAPLTWAARGLLTATTVPVGALAGCVVAAVAATAQNPGLGVAGLAAAGVPLTLRGLRARHRARRGAVRARGRHLAGVDALGPLQALSRLDPAVDPAEPSPAAARALSLVPVAAATATGIPAPRTPADEAVEQAVALAVVGSAVDDAVAAAVEPVVRAEVVVRVGAPSDDLVVDVEVLSSAVAPEQRAAEIAQLNRLWAAGTGPDTGQLRATASAA